MEISIIIAALLVGAAICLRFIKLYRKKTSKVNSTKTTKEEIPITLKNISGLSVSKFAPGIITVDVAHVCKSYDTKAVVDDVSFEVRSGEILGMVGPNGAGKTTTIRMLMDIIKADSGEIKILGEPIHENIKNKIGYLPEERGLYRKITVDESLNYLARLKNLDPATAKKNSGELLQYVDMFQHKDKKIEQLSKGMSQLIQFITTIVHDPDVIILDEPFSGLDPVNRELLKGLIIELRGLGKTIMLSTHQMNEVEELCDRILMINKGKVVLYGDLSEIRSRFRSNSIFVEFDGESKDLSGIINKKNHGKYIELFLDETTTPQEILSQILSQGVKIDRFEISTPSLNEIFIEVAKEN